LIILNIDTFTSRGLAKAGYQADPRTTGVLDSYQVVEVDVTKLTLEAVASFGLSKSDAGRCKNFWALGLVQWMFNRDVVTIEAWITKRFSKETTVRDANLAALKAGHAYGETAELTAAVPHVATGTAQFLPGEYRGVRGSEALALGLAAAGELADRRIIFCSYPITPASPLLHQLARLGHLGIGVFQAEDEIAAVCAAIGAAYGGAIGITSSSGPGIALKTEAIGLAINAELPLIVINSQRGGPSTGLPTKTEQSDLYQAVYGRNADAPIPVLAACSPGDCFEVAIEAVRIALRHMTPVMLLSDGYLAHAAEPWRLPNVDEIPRITTNAPGPRNVDQEVGSVIFARDSETFGRPWVAPGTPDLMHRIGGLEKDLRTGNISYEAQNHQAMTQLRADKIASVAKFIPAQEVEIGATEGALAVVGWGSTYGALYQAVRRIPSHERVSHIHIRHLSPFPQNLGDLLRGFDRILVPEMNMGQLASLLRDKLGVEVVQQNKVTGQPFLVSELVQKIRSLLAVQPAVRAAPKAISGDRA
jgi:2-oxoglutarate ferredoxin oxidoreductase subunit alpha